MIKHKWIFVTALLLTFFMSQASIICPPEKHVMCYDDISYLPLMGTPTVLGGGSGQLRYFDSNSGSMCNAGHIVRTWYLDANGNQQFDNNEEACTQDIYATYVPSTVDISWPVNVSVICEDDIPDAAPSWTSGPCDMIGVSKVDEILRTGNSACYKIMRHFTVINWCTYVSGTSTGIWTHTQMIAINDPSRPAIQQCGEVTIGTNVDCKATFTVSNSAVDISPCGTQLLSWKAEIDLWNDGSIDYTYFTNNIDARFRLVQTKSGETLSLTLPELVMTGWHTVTWTVNDLCGNATKCVQKVHVKDTKKPTPYMYEILSAAFEGKPHPLKIAARQFNLGSFDNCTKSSLLRYSFSTNVNDTIRIVDCNNAGFQFYTIYVTDLEGNQEFTEVYLLAFDNGACSNTLRLQGNIREGNGTPLTGADIMLRRTLDPAYSRMAKSTLDGSYQWSDISLYEDMEIMPEYTASDADRVDIADLKMLQDYIFGIHTLTNYQLVAADTDGDSKISANDMKSLKNRILEIESDTDSNWVITSYTDSVTHTTQLADLYSRTHIRLNNVQNPVRFTGILKGDITGANSSASHPRSITEFKVKSTSKGMSWYPESSSNIAGVQLVISGIDLNTVSLSSAYFDIPEDAMHIQDGQMKIVILKDIKLNPDIPLIQVSGSPSMYKNVSVDATSRLLLPGYNISKIKIRSSSVELTSVKITPNPVHEYFEISDNNVKVLKIINQTGVDILFRQSENRIDWQVPPGVYFVTLEVEGSTITKKLIRL